MIVATAGHVDHGKTSLVRSLTGVDTDRLAEEKRRGMSIELGFAYADFAGARIGFVDVPGHERFVRNMLAGVAAIDFALLVIAADDGPMPQTREHVAILDLLGVKRGAVALTKIDRVAETRIAEVRGQIAGLLAPTGLANAPVFPVVATDETSIGALRQHLGIAENAADIKPADGYFRLAVDRAFVLPGIGLIATGAVFAGEARVGDRLTVSPLGKSVRLRSIRTQDRPSEIARAGDRAALNIAGDVERAELQRGDWIVAPEVHAPADRIDVRLHVLPGEARALAHWTPVHVHLGAADVTGRVAVLEGRSIAPGTQGLAQLVLDQPAGALTHDRFVLRDQSALRTIAGGMVLDPFAPARGRSKPHRLAALAAHSLGSPDAALAALADAVPDAVDLARFECAWNLKAGPAAEVRARAKIVVAGDGERRLGVSQARWGELLAALPKVLAEWHAQHPDSLGPNEAQLLKLVGPRVAPPVLTAALRSLIAGAAVARDGLSLRLAGHRPQLGAMDAVLLDEVANVLRAKGIRPPNLLELAKALELELDELRAFLPRASRLGHLMQVAKNRYFLPETLAALARVAEALSHEAGDGGFDAAQYRDRSGIGRNLTIEVLEFFDKVGLTRRDGDRRRLLRAAAEVFGEMPC